MPSHAQAARSALIAASKVPAGQAASEEESRELPAFGSGLEFRPQGKLAASKSSVAAPGAAQRANESGPGISVALEDELGDEGDDMEADEQVCSTAASWEAAPFPGWVKAGQLCRCLAHSPW